MDYDPTELMAVAACRSLKDGQTVFAGAGMPLLASLVAQRLHAPTLTVLFEVGSISPIIEVGKLPQSVNESRCAYGSAMISSVIDTLSFCQRGCVDVGFLGGAQIDKFGNLNSSIVGPWNKPKVRLPGTGGANDIASNTNFMVVTVQDKRKFVEKVDFITSPGYLSGGNSRREAGLPVGGPIRVITNLGILGFDPVTKEMVLEALHPGVNADEVRANTGWDLKVAKSLAVTELPTERELAMFRLLDPERRFLRVR